MADQIIFEHPLNEKCRTLLRLSHLFEQFEHHLALQTEWSSRAALLALLDVAAVLSRADIKSELLKELERRGVSADLALREAQAAFIDKRHTGNIVVIP